MNQAYTYDQLNQLTKAVIDGQTFEYTYDSLGNRTSKKTPSGTNTYTFNGANQLINDGQTAFTYDGNGNLTKDKEYTYTWNDFDQLETVKKGTTEIAKYQYDENGRRISSKIGAEETYYRYDGSSNHVLFGENKAGEMNKAYTYDENGHPLTMIVGDNVYYYLTNYRGDVIALTSEDGTVVAEYTYDAWGNILTQSGTMAKENPYRYAGYRYDEETKLYYVMARYYNPDTGVFLSLDPVRGDTTNPITMNGYNYANNNPVMLMDKNGNFAQFIPVAIGVVRAIKISYDVYKHLKKMKNLTKYVNVTKGKNVTNISTNLTKKNFEQNLLNDGWKKSISKDGKINIFTKDGDKYTTRSFAKSTDGPTADFLPKGEKTSLKIRLKK